MTIVLKPPRTVGAGDIVARDPHTGHRTRLIVDGPPVWFGEHTEIPTRDRAGRTRWLTVDQQTRLAVVIPPRARLAHLLRAVAERLDGAA